MKERRRKREQKLKKKKKRCNSGFVLCYVELSKSTLHYKMLPCRNVFAHTPPVS
jgi:hypothetical protein